MHGRSEDEQLDAPRHPVLRLGAQTAKRAVGEHGDICLEAGSPTRPGNPPVSTATRANSSGRERTRHARLPRPRIKAAEAEIRSMAFEMRTDAKC